MAPPATDEQQCHFPTNILQIIYVQIHHGNKITANYHQNPSRLRLATQAFNGPFFCGKPVPQKAKPIWILLKQKIVGGRLAVASAGSYTSLHLTPDSSFLQARCPSCYPTKSIKALKGWQNNQKRLAKHACADQHLKITKKNDWTG